MTRYVLSVIIVLVTAAGCTQRPNGVLASASPSTSPGVRDTAVGPVPGPDKTIPQPDNPFAEKKPAMVEGRRLFLQMNCAGCHGDHAGGGMGPSLRDVDWLYGSSDAQIFGTIRQGRAHGMPTWQTKLSDDQIWQLVTYIKSLRTRNEPEPPEP